MNELTIFVISLLSMTLICDCTEQDIQQNPYSTYLLDTTSMDGIITPRVNPDIKYRFKNCTINDILKKYFIATNELLYQLAKQINVIFETKKNEVNVLLNKGILNNGHIRDNIDAETTVLNQAITDMQIQNGFYETAHNKLVDNLELDISKVTTGKISVDQKNVNQIKLSIQQITSKTKAKTSKSVLLALNQLKVAFYRSDNAALKMPIADTVKAVKQFERNAELDFQDAENKIMDFHHGAEQEIVKVTETICVDLMK